MPKTILRALARALAILTCSLVLTSAGGALAAPTRIMPLGDSITGSPGCWRALLWNKLQTNGYTNIDMVGTLPAQGCGVPYDGDNEGHGGILATNMASGNQLPPWLAATTPDVVMMHLGTNDVWSARTNEQILGAFTTLVGQMRAQNPTMKILVAQIIPMDTRACAACPQRVIDFNAAIPAWAASLSTAQSPITVVDQWTGFNDTTDTGDGVHPNDAGIQKISERWYPAVVAALSGTPTPSFALSASPASLSLTLPESAGGSTSSTITVTPSGGFTGSVTLGASGLPSGATASFSPASTTGTSVMTISVPANVQLGTYTVTVTGTSGSLTRTTAVSLAIGRVIPQDFALSLTPATLSLAQGASGTVSVGVARIQGFAGSVQLAASGLPSGVTASFSPNPATGATSTLTLTASATATVGSANVTITGTSGSLVHTATLALTVGTTTSTFTLSAAPATVTVTQGGSGTSTISIARTNYTAAVAFTASGLPAGVTASFSPASTTANSSTLTLTATGTATIGPATVTITGAGASGSLSRTTTVSLTVNASGGGTAPCSPAVNFTGNTNNFNTTGAVCYRTSAKINGWGCYNMDGRTLSVNNVTVTCGAALPAAWSDGYTYFAATAGTYPWAGIYTW